MGHSKFDYITVIIRRNATTLKLSNFTYCHFPISRRSGVLARETLSPQTERATSRRQIGQPRTPAAHQMRWRRLRAIDGEGRGHWRRRRASRSSARKRRPRRAAAAESDGTNDQIDLSVGPSIRLPRLRPVAVDRNFGEKLNKYINRTRILWTITSKIPTGFLPPELKTRIPSIGWVRQTAVPPNLTSHAASYNIYRVSSNSSYFVAHAQLHAQRSRKL